jgi:hypothetical protein
MEDGTDTLSRNVGNQLTLCNNPKERRSELYRGESLKSGNLSLTQQFDTVINAGSAMRSQTNA